MRLQELFSINESESEEDLYYLLHDKEHVVKPGQKIKALERKLSKPDKCLVSLYRGIDKYNYEQLSHLVIGDKFTLKSYWSASEYKSVANSFSKRYRTDKVVEILAPTNGFCLWQWGVDGLEALKSSDAEAYDQEDGDFLIDSYKEEAEWIMGIGQVFEVVELLDGFPSKIVQINT